MITNDQDREHFEAIVAERDRMRPIVEAAKTWAASINRSPTGYEVELVAALAEWEAFMSTPTADLLDGYPEAYCHRCGGPNIVSWFADSPVWNRVMRGGSINGDEPHDGIVCPVCFAAMAYVQGVATQWRLCAEDVRVELETATPSGRIWNDVTHLWMNPPAEHQGTMADGTYVDDEETPAAPLGGYPTNTPDLEERA